MTIDLRSMHWTAPVFALALLACTKPNPARSCDNGTCTDPAFPYCDVGGEISGSPDTCTAVTCTPGSFAACRGDTAITCNAAGTNFDDVKCERGCDATTGCHLCDPNQTACTNGTVATCDANGHVISKQDCALGCFESEPRCRDIDPSNNLGEIFDRIAKPPNLDLKSSCAFNTTNGVVTQNVNGVQVPVDGIPTFTAPNGGLPFGIRVFVVNDLHIESDCVVDGDSPIAVLARGEIAITGRWRSHFAGSMSLGACGVSAGGASSYSDVGGIVVTSGSGGGGFATAGGRGGDIVGSFTGGVGGLPTGNDTLVPLRGGCPSGPVNQGPVGVGIEASGGGAIQLSSAKRIFIDGVVDVRGNNGEAQIIQPGVANAGGGAGGGLLLEAPEVVLGPNARLVAKGGAGAALGPSQPIDDTANPSLGPICNDPRCSSGGNGSAPGVPAGSGANVTRPGGTGDASTGAGGGGLGRIRVNTPDGTYSKTNTSVEAAALTAGAVKTR